MIVYIDDEVCGKLAPEPRGNGTVTMVCPRRSGSRVRAVQGDDMPYFNLINIRVFGHKHEEDILLEKALAFRGRTLTLWDAFNRKPKHEIFE